MCRKSHANGTHHTVRIIGRIHCAFAHLHFNASLIVGQQLLRSMVPDYVQGRLQCTFDYAAQDHCASGLNIAIRIA